MFEACLKCFGRVILQVGLSHIGAFQEHSRCSSSQRMLSRVARGQNLEPRQILLRVAAGWACPTNQARGGDHSGWRQPHTPFRDRWICICQPKAAAVGSQPTGPQCKPIPTTTTTTTTTTTATTTTTPTTTTTTTTTTTQQQHQQQPPQHPQHPQQPQQPQQP